MPTNISGVDLLACEQCGELTPQWDVEDVFGDEVYITKHEPKDAEPHYGTPAARRRDAILASKYRDRTEVDPLDDRSDIQPFERTTKFPW